MPDKVKACPFCGEKKPRIVTYKADNKHLFSDKYAVQCQYTGEDKGCGAEGQMNKILDFAIEAWNRRSEPRRRVDRNG